MATGDEILAWKKAAEEEESIQTSCPECGERLETHPDGTLHCPFDGWTYPTRYGRRIF